ncbi:MAG: GNAT family N-acetyltransferase [Clostridia bacterium]|nr:GNAT family N-acetyltransferase [Clostridia bacterium]
MVIKNYEEKYKENIIDLILDIQNNEANINLSIEEQPDLLDVEKYYLINGGQFWIAVDEKDKVIGTIAYMAGENNYGILKKFFVDKNCRGKGIGLELYKNLLRYANKKSCKGLILDTPSVAEDSHRFYEKAGFRKISKEELPIKYYYPNRNSYIYILFL